MPKQTLPGRRRASPWAALVPLLLLGVAAPAAQSGHDTDPETGLERWQWRHQGVSLQLVQRLPDQTRAFFLGRGFDAAQADRIARACVFQIIFRNDGDRVVAFDLDRWRVARDGERRPLLTREGWAERLPGAGNGPLIALRWSLLPTRQRFQPGDYNWGMTSFGLPPGERFDLELELEVDGTTVRDRLPGVRCAPEQP